MSLSLPTKQSHDVSEIVRAIRLVCKFPNELHEPVINEDDHELVKQCLETTFVSTVGEFVPRFEQSLVEKTKIKHVVCLASGTSALHLVLHALGVESGEEVLVPSLSFVATANAVSHCGAVPHFVDIEKETLGICPERLRTYLSDHVRMCDGESFNITTGKKISALVCVHVFGHICRVEELQEIAQEYRLAFIEDAAEALGSFRDGFHAGTYSDAAILSFNGNKIVTTGAGGAVLCRDSELAQKVRHLASTAKVDKSSSAYFHDQVAFNYRMSNLNAALGCAQMNRLDKFLAIKRQIYDRYREAFRGLEQVRCLEEPVNCQSNNWLNTIIFNENDQHLVDTVEKRCHQVGVGVRRVWDPLNSLPMYKNNPKSDLGNTKQLASLILNLPSGCGVLG